MAQLRWDALKGRLAYIVAERDSEAENLKKVSSHEAQLVNQGNTWFLKVPWTMPSTQIECLLAQATDPVCTCKY